jgi:hypothetical protein
VSPLLPLTRVAPGIVEAIVDGRELEWLRLARMHGVAIAVRSEMELNGFCTMILY